MGAAAEIETGPIGDKIVGDTAVVNAVVIDLSEVKYHS